METRKIQENKSGSYLLTLPKHWVKRHSLGRGSIVGLVVDKDLALKIKPPKAIQTQPMETTLKLEDYDFDLKLLSGCVKACYMQGDDTIHIVSDKPINYDLKRKIRAIFSEFSGMELAEENPNKMTFKVIVDSAKIPPELLLRRALTLTTSLQRDAVKSVVERNCELASEVISIGGESLKLYRLMIRQLSLAIRNPNLAKELGLEVFPDCLIRAVAARDISRLAYHATAIAKQTFNLKSEIKKPIIDKLIELSEFVYEMQKEVYASFFKGDIKLSYDVVKKMDKVKELYDKLLVDIMIRHKKDIETAISLSMIVREIRRIAGYTVALADTVLSRVFIK